MNHTVFLIGFAIMSLASLAIYAKGSKAVDIRHHTYFHAAVPFLAATSYLAMYLGLSETALPGGGTTFVARYADWSVTTPILLSGLVLLGLHERGRPMAFLVSVIVLDVMMIVAGLFSSLSVAPAARLIWYVWSCVAFAGVLYVLWVPIRAISVAEGGAMSSAYAKNLSFLSIVWFAYPIVFAIGPEGIGTIDSLATAWAILALDVVAKVVYAFFSGANVERAARA